MRTVSLAEQEAQALNARFATPPRRRVRIGNVEGGRGIWVKVEVEVEVG